jgi:hypothetical protein
MMIAGIPMGIEMPAGPFGRIPYWSMQPAQDRIHAETVRRGILWLIRKTCSTNNL